MKTFENDDFGVPLPNVAPHRGDLCSPLCHECPFAKNGLPNRPVAGEGVYNPRFIIVGESPGGSEIALGRPFIGQSGAIVARMLEQVQERREDLWIANAILCRPPEKATEDQKKQARRCCNPRLLAELAKLSCNNILTLGAHAGQAILGDGFSVGKQGGCFFEVTLNNTQYKVVPEVHPAAIIRGGARVGGAHSPDLAFWNLIYAAAKMKSFADGKDITFKCERGVDLEYEYEDMDIADQLLNYVIDQAYAQKFVALDTETYVTDEKRYSALKPMQAQLRALGLAVPDYSVSVHWDVVSPSSRERIRKLLTNPDIICYMHNSLYDREVMRQHGYPVYNQIQDSMLAHHAAFPGMAHDLQRVATQFFAVHPWKAEYRDSGDSKEDLCKYNALDTLVTARLFAPLDRAIDKWNVRNIYNLDLEMASAANEMHVAGVPVSREVNEELHQFFSKNLETAKASVEALANDPVLLPKIWERLAAEQAKKKRKNDSADYDERKQARLDKIQADHAKGKWFWNIRAGDHIAAYLKARGVPLYKVTAKGATSTKKDILEAFAHYPDVRAILDFKENEKLLSTYIWRMFDRQIVSKKGKSKTLWGFCDEYDRAHPTWTIHKITGRWGSEAPVFQNVPKEDKKKGRPNLRRQVVAQEGKLLVGFDFKQLEVRLHLLASSDDFLRNIFDNNLDPHIEFARIVWPTFDQLDESTRKKLRDQVKRPEYGALYGGSVQTLFENLRKDNPSIKFEDIAKMVSIMSAKLVGVNAWHAELLRDVTKPPYEVRTVVLGRRRCFPLGQASPNDVFNFPIQGAGSDLMNTGLARVLPRLKRFKECVPILQIHDAAVFECWEDDADAVRAIVKDSFTQQYTNRDGVTVVFGVDDKIGKSWDKV